VKVVKSFASVGKIVNVRLHMKPLIWVVLGLFLPEVTMTTHFSSIASRAATATSTATPCYYRSEQPGERVEAGMVFPAGILAIRCAHCSCACFSLRHTVFVAHREQKRRIIHEGSFHIHIYIHT
jgi:hypothetical protein